MAWLPKRVGCACEHSAVAARVRGHNGTGAINNMVVELLSSASHVQLATIRVLLAALDGRGVNALDDTGNSALHSPWVRQCGGVAILAPIRTVLRIQSSKQFG